MGRSLTMRFSLQKGTAGWHGYIFFRYLSNRGSFKRKKKAAGTAGPAAERTQGLDQLLAFASGSVCICSQIGHQLKKRGGLADKQAHRRQEFHHGRSRAARLRRTNNAAARGLAAEKWAGL